MPRPAASYPWLRQLIRLSNADAQQGQTGGPLIKWSISGRPASSVEPFDIGRPFTPTPPAAKGMKTVAEQPLSLGRGRHVTLGGSSLNPVPTIDLTDKQLESVIRIMRRAIDEDGFPAL
jgi:hypothetical protein